MTLLNRFIIIFSFVAISVSGQVVDSNDSLQQEYLWKKQSFLILKSTRDYNEARVFAANARKLLNAGSDDRDLEQHDGLGLTLPKSVCLEEGDTYPCYVVRGRDGQDSLWTSVDLSSAYTGFANGYFIVILAHGNPENPFLREALDRAHKFFPDAYLKLTEVYIGCMH